MISVAMLYNKIMCHDIVLKYWDFLFFDLKWWLFCLPKKKKVCQSVVLMIFCKKEKRRRNSDIAMIIFYDLML